MLDRGGSTACQMDPGYDVDLVVTGNGRELHRWLLGWRTLRDLHRTGDVRLLGPTTLARAFAGWFAAPSFARSYGTRPRLAAAG